jgi:hypothetical protein
MKDQDIVRHRAQGSSYLEPGHSRDLVATINRLIAVLTARNSPLRLSAWKKGYKAEGREVRRAPSSVPPACR